jgi:hypothetical protein
MTDGRVDVVLDELDAIRKALASADGEDLITIMADDVAGVLAYLDLVSSGGDPSIDIAS